MGRLADMCESWERLKANYEMSDEAAAMLAIAGYIFPLEIEQTRNSAENLGHDLALALKNVFKESIITITEG